MKTEFKLGDRVKYKRQHFTTQAWKNFAATPNCFGNIVKIIGDYPYVKFDGITPNGNAIESFMPSKLELISRGDDKSNNHPLTKIFV